MIDLSAERRRRLTHRALPALVVLARGVGRGGDDGRSGHLVGGGADGAQRFTEAWERQDYRAMYALLDDASRRAYSVREFRRAYRDAGGHRDRAASGGRRSERRARRDGGRADRPAHARLRPRLRPSCGCPVDGEQVTWGPLLAFPGLRRGEALSRRSEPARRGDPAVARRQGAGARPGRQPHLPARGDRRARSRGRSRPRRPRRSAARSTRTASRAAGRSGRTASRRRSRTGWRGAPAAS